MSFQEPSSPFDLSKLLAQNAWVQRLARTLVRDAQQAEDLAQETMVEALRRPPQQALNLRGWLAAVLRRRASHARRAQWRREQRETLVARDAKATADESAQQRMLLQRDLVEHVLALDEIYRTVIVLQFFDGLPPREIAARLGLPVNTVRSRVQRGLAQLRARLSAGHAGKDEWVAAIASLGWPRAGGPAAVAASLGVGILMQGKLLALAAAALAAGLWFFLSIEGPSVASGPEASLATRIPERIAGEAVALGAAQATTQRAVEARAEPAPATTVAVANEVGLGGRLLDTNGQALGGVRVRRHGTLTPRWQGGDLGYVSDGENSRFISEADLKKLREDSAAAAKFFDGLERADEWRALLLGAACPERETLSAADGSFRFPTPGADTQVDVVEPGWQTLALGHDGSGASVWIAARSIDVAGRVLDPTWQPLKSGKVEFVWSPETALGRLGAGIEITQTWEADSINVGDAGRYLLRGVPAGLLGGSLRAECPGLAPEVVPAPFASTESFDIVFSGARAAGLLDIDGRVVDGSGGAIADAEVILDRQKTRTDAQGRFAFAGIEVRDRGLLSVLARGFAAKQRAGLIDAVRRDPQAGRGLLITLDEPARMLRGVVLDAGGRALSDLRVNVLNPALLDFSFTPLEGRSGGWEQGVPTDSAGRFELGGLAQRSYRLRVWRPDDSFTLLSEVFPAGANDVIVRVGPESILAQVRGRVLSSAGSLPDDLEVAVAYPIHVTRSGAGSMSEGSSFRSVASDGTFMLEDVPRNAAFFVLKAQGHPMVLTPVENVQADGSVVLEFAPQRILNVLTCGALGESSLTVVDANDRPLDVESFANGTRYPGRLQLPRDGRFAPLRIPREASAVLLQREDGSWQRFPIGDDDSGLSQVVVGP